MYNFPLPRLISRYAPIPPPQKPHLRPALPALHRPLEMTHPPLPSTPFSTPSHISTSCGEPTWHVQNRRKKKGHVANNLHSIDSRLSMNSKKTPRPILNWYHSTSHCHTPVPISSSPYSLISTYFSPLLLVSFYRRARRALEGP